MEKSIFTTTSRPSNPPNIATPTFNEGPTLDTNITNIPEELLNSCALKNILETVSDMRRNKDENESNETEKETNLYENDEILPEPDEHFVDSQVPNRAVSMTNNFNHSEDTEWEIISIPYSKTANQKRHESTEMRPKSDARPGGSKSSLELEDGHSNVMEVAHYDSDAFISSDMPIQLEDYSFKVNELGPITQLNVSNAFIDGKEDTITRSQGASSSQKLYSRHRNNFESEDEHSNVMDITRSNSETSFVLADTSVQLHNCFTANEITPITQSNISNAFISRNENAIKSGVRPCGSKSSLEGGHPNGMDSTYSDSETSFIPFHMSTQLEDSFYTANEINPITQSNVSNDFMGGKEDAITSQGTSSSQNRHSRGRNFLLPSQNVFKRSLLREDISPCPSTANLPIHHKRARNRNSGTSTTKVDQENRCLTLRKCGRSDPSMELPSSSKTQRERTSGIKTRTIRAKKSKSTGCLTEHRRYQAVRKFSLQNFVLGIIKDQHPYLILTSEAALKMEVFLADVVQRLGDEAKNLVTLSSKKRVDSRVLKYAIKLTLERIKKEGEVACGRKDMWLF